MDGSGDGGLDWTAVGTIVALIGLIVTFAFTLRADRRQTVRGREDAERAKRSEDAARAAAERSEAAASLTIDSLQRIADSLDKIAEKPAGKTLLAAAIPGRVSWSLTHSQGDRYMVTNTGDASAYDVTLYRDESLLAPEWPEPQTLKSGEAVTFIALKTMGTRDSTITVEWKASADAAELETWRYPLPPRPPR